MTTDDLFSSIFMLVTLSLLVGSVGIWIQIVRRNHQGLPLVPERFRWRKVRVPRVPLAITLGILILTGVSVASSTSQAAKPPLDDIRSMVWGSLIEGLLVILFLGLGLALGARSRTDLTRLGFRSDQFMTQLRFGFLGFVATILPVGMMLLLTTPLRSEETEHPFLRLLKETGWGPGLLAIILTAAVIAPLKEELMFRVILQSWLEEFCPAWLAVLLSSAAFAAVHGIPDSLALIPLALILGILYQKRRSYLTVVSVHAFFNLYNLLATLITE